MQIRPYVLTTIAAGTIATLLGYAAVAPVQSQTGPHKTDISTRDDSGELRSLFLNGATFDKTNPFFQSLGTNGRACITCHVPADGWTITPEHVQRRFERTGGLDPLFNPVDGTDSPNAKLSSVEARHKASGMLLNKGLIRIGIGIPAGAEFTLSAVDDPYHFASATQLSLFRRPLPTTNLRFLTTVMWDGRESTPLTGTAAISAALSDAQNYTNLITDLMHQANDATTGHAQAAQNLTETQESEIVNFEMSIATAQQFDFDAGRLDADGALGGPANLATQDFYVTINDVLGADHFGIPFNSSAMTLFDAWENSRDSARARIARGQALFNTKPIAITGVGGLNDALNLPVINGTCTTCHDAPDVGNHSVALPINIGIADASRRTPDLPLYTLQNIATGATVQTTDPGRALITGKWADIGKFKGPILRGLASRAPYFHNGSAADLGAAVDFYNTRFNVGFTKQEKDDLIAFLRTL